MRQWVRWLGSSYIFARQKHEQATFQMGSGGHHPHLAACTACTHTVYKHHSPQFDQATTCCTASRGCSSPCSTQHVMNMLQNQKYEMRTSQSLLHKPAEDAAIIPLSETRSMHNAPARAAALAVPPAAPCCSPPTGGCRKPSSDWARASTRTSLSGR